jgi:hypothetical protein
MRLPFRRRPIAIEARTAFRTDYGGQADLGVRPRQRRLSLFTFHLSPLPPTPDHPFPVLGWGYSNYTREGFAQSVGVSESAL